MDHDPPGQVLDRNESLRPPAATTLREGLLCASCGYDLRGSPSGGRCPECGARSPVRNLLGLARFGGEAWLRNAHRRIRFWPIALGASVLAVIVNGVPALYPPGPTLSDYVCTTIALLVVWVSTSVLAIGVWALTARHPVIDRDGPPISSRRVARAALLSAIVALFIAFTCPTTFLCTRWWGKLCVAMALPMGPAGVVGALGLTRRVGHLYQAAGEEPAMRISLLAGELYASVCVLNVVIVVATGAIWMGDVLAAPGLGVLIGAFGLMSICTPCFLSKHLWVACAELAKQKNAATMARAADEIDDGPSSSIR